MDWFRALHGRLRERGTTLVFITHRLGEIRDLCDTVTVLRNGCAVGTHAVDEVDDDEVVRLMIGRDMEQAFPDRRAASERKVVLECRGLTHAPAFCDVDLELREGEILGVAGLDGQGQRELFLSLFGVLRSDSGDVLVDGEPVSIHSPRDAIDAKIGISLVPEDRKTEGLFLKLATERNMTLPALDGLSTAGWIDERESRRRVRETAEELNLDPDVVGSEVGELSGGNQQKVVLGKWVLAGSRFLLLYDPTRGVDVGDEVRALQAHPAPGRRRALGAPVLERPARADRPVRPRRRVLPLERGGRVQRRAADRARRARRDRRPGAQRRMSAASAPARRPAPSLLDAVRRQWTEGPVVAGAVLVVLLVIYASSASLFTSFTLQAICNDAAALALAAVGATLVVITGGFDLSVGAIMGLVNVLLATHLKGSAGHDALWVALTLVIATAAGAVNGALVAYLRLQSIIVTIATLFIFSGSR